HRLEYELMLLFGEIFDLQYCFVYQTIILQYTTEHFFLNHSNPCSLRIFSCSICVRLFRGMVSHSFNPATVGNRVSVSTYLSIIYKKRSSSMCLNFSYQNFITAASSFLFFEAR